jgi:SAM-dependent methyltransferase
MRLKNFVPKSIRRVCKQLLYRGDKHICPICGYRSKQLENIGHNYPVLIEKEVIGAGLRAAGCYRCGTDDRERLIYLYLRDFVKIFKHKELKVLHIAPEFGIAQRLLKHLGDKNYIAADKFTEGYTYPSFVQNVDLLDLKFESNNFDLVICNHVLEHIVDDRLAMSQIFRVLKPGGKAILQVPFSPKHLTFEDFSITNPIQRQHLFGQHDHVRIYGSDYFDRLKEVGFTTERISLALNMEYLQFDLNQKEEIFLASKPL